MQSELFPNLKGVHYIPSSSIREETSKIMKQDDFSFQDDHVKNNIKKNMLAGKNLISNEGLIGNFYLYNLVNARLIADRLARLFSGAKILIVVRNQYELIESLYKQYLHVGGTKSFREFLHFKNGKFEHSYCEWDSTVNPEMFNFLNVLEYYEKLFGRENLCVIPFELMKTAPDKFTAKLLSWLGVKEIPSMNKNIRNPGYGARQIIIARFFNKFLKSPFKETALFPDATLPLTGKIDGGKLRLILQSRLSRKLLGKKPITDEILRSKIRRIYADSNRQMNEKYQLSLDEICPGEYF